MKISTPFLNIGLNTFYQALSRATIATAALIITRLLVTKLGIEGYGRYQVVVIYASLFWFFSDFGLNTLVVREASANPRRIQEFFSTLFSLRSLLGLILIIIAFLGLIFLPYSPQVKTAAIISISTIYFQSIIGVATAIFQIKGQYKFLFISNIIGSFVLLSGVYLILNIHGSLISLALIFAASYLTVMIAALYFVHKWVRLKLIWDIKLVKYLITKSFPLGLSMVFNHTAYSQDALLLSLLKIPKITNEAAVATYNVAYKIFELSIVIPGYLANVLYPVLNLQFAKRDFVNFKRYFYLSFIFLFLSGLIGFVVLILSRSWLIRLVTNSNQFADSNIVLSILAIALPISFILPLLLILTLIFRKEKLLMIIYGIAFLFNLLANIIFIPQYYYLASAAITVLTEILILVLLSVSSVYLWKKHLK